jgi:Peptidase family M1 domain
MKRILFLICTFHLATAIAQKPYFQQKVDTKIVVALNDSNHVLHGHCELTYQNNAPKALEILWIHLWANAYASKTTAFAEQQLRNGETEFYFTPPPKMGYIRDLNFTVNGKPVEVEPHPTSIDIVKLKLKTPLAAGAKCTISTPFKVKIPQYVSRLGHQGQSYQITQWFPKPAVYDVNGWHPIPYLAQGEFYSEFGDYDVTITLPDNYVVAATGELQNEAEKLFLNQKIENANQLIRQFKNKKFVLNDSFPKSSTQLKTIQYIAKNVHDFAWFADKRFQVQKSSVLLKNGQKVETWVLFTHQRPDLWQNAVEYVNKAVKFRSEVLGAYPYSHATALHNDTQSSGMEYPMITLLGYMDNAKNLEQTIEHEVGHNWFYGILASNERANVWMDEGLNNYYDARYNNLYHISDSITDFVPSFLAKKTDYTGNELVHLYLANRLQNQPSAISSEQMTNFNYWMGGYDNPAMAFRLLEKYVGTDLMDKAMQTYYEKWKFKHPQPTDFQQVMESVTGKKLSWLFDDLIGTTKKVDYALKKVENKDDSYEVTIQNVGEIATPFEMGMFKNNQLIYQKMMDGTASIQKIVLPKMDVDQIVLDPNHLLYDSNRQNNTITPKNSTFEPISFRFGIGLDDSRKTNIYYAPLAGYNSIDGLMLGAVFYNSTQPRHKFEYTIAPMFGLSSKLPIGVADFKYFVDSKKVQIIPELLLKQFSYNYSERWNAFQHYMKITPMISAIWKTKPQSAWTHTARLRTNLIREQSFQYDTVPKYIGKVNENTVIHDFTYSLERKYVLSNTFLKLNLEQQSYGMNDKYLKAGLEWRQTWMYERGKSIHFRMYAGKFLQNTRRNSANFLSIARGSFSLTGQNFNDYRYDDYFISRNETNSLLKQQINTNYEGGMKFALGAQHATIGFTNDYMVAFNLKTDIPKVKYLRPYFDLGYAHNSSAIVSAEDGWLATGGLALELGDYLGVYFPIYHSATIKNRFNRGYLNQIVFKIDFQKTNPIQVIRNLLDL